MSFDVDGHLARLQQQGYSIIPDFLSADHLRAVREGLAPFLGTHRGRNNFEGTNTERVYTLVANGAVIGISCCPGITLKASSRASK